MHCTVGELGRRLGAAEFGRWLAFMAAEELGPAAERARHAELMAALHNGPLTRKSKALWSAAEFAPRPWAPAAARVPAKPKPATGADARAFLARRNQG